MTPFFRFISLMCVGSLFQGVLASSITGFESKEMRDAFLEGLQWGNSASNLPEHPTETASKETILNSDSEGNIPPPCYKCSNRSQDFGDFSEIDINLRVFISFSVPEETWLHLSSELEQFGGAFVLRGLPGSSFADFFQKMKVLKERGVQAPILINPEDFERFAIQSVPSIVLEHGAVFDKLAGNVPLSHALALFAESGETRPKATELLRLKGHL